MLTGSGGCLREMCVATCCTVAALRDLHIDHRWDKGGDVLGAQTGTCCLGLPAWVKSSNYKALMQQQRAPVHFKLSGHANQE
jgi:hypothetical protein